MTWSLNPKRSTSMSSRRSFRNPEELFIKSYCINAFFMSCSHEISAIFVSSSSSPRSSSWTFGALLAPSRTSASWRSSSYRGFRVFMLSTNLNHDYYILYNETDLNDQNKTPRFPTTYSPAFEYWIEIVVVRRIPRNFPSCFLLICVLRFCVNRWIMCWLCKSWPGWINIIRQKVKFLTEQSVVHYFVFLVHFELERTSNYVMNQTRHLEYI